MTDIETIKNAFAGRTPIGEHWARHYAVILPLIDGGADGGGEASRDGAGGPAILYEVRASDLDRQPGEVCFPGGQIEPGETPLEAALRETEEELGICRDEVEIIAKLDTICTRAGSHIHCFVGVIGLEAFARMNVSRAEVAEVFTVPVEDLLNTECEIIWNPLKEVPAEDFPYNRVTSGEAYKWKDGRVPVPVFDVNGRIIWGLTGRMTMEFLEVLKCCD